jgi:ATP-dependent helicase/nuclease subunit A
MQLKIISAGAGSGKTHRLTSEMVSLLASGAVKAPGIIATTFTNKAAAELQERVRVRLLGEGLSKEANELGNALIGTVHGLGVRLLQRFAFEAGVSPQVDIIAGEDQQVMFNQSLAEVLTNERVEEMEKLASRLGLNKSDRFATDWRRVLKDLTEVARSNNFSPQTLDKSRQLSFDSFCRFLEPGTEDAVPDLPNPAAWNDTLKRHLGETIDGLENNADETKKTKEAGKMLKEMLGELNLRGELFWHQWVKIAKVNAGAKSRDDVAALVDFANAHIYNPAFQNDIRSFIFNLFNLAGAAIAEYDDYKKKRGLIDYTDMEVLVNKLLGDEAIQAVMSDELDLLMVDEFQDTSPIQLEIFLKLSRFAKYSIWVGDPKQSIYGFRGAEPALMKAIIQSQGGLKPENILEYSWRSREDIVHATNGIFTRAFSDMPPEQVALKPKRKKNPDPASVNKTGEPPEMGEAMMHWHFNYDGEGRPPGRVWFNGCIANALRTELERGLVIHPKGEKSCRPALPGDVAILCRTNNECLEMAKALHAAGLRAAISRAGLLNTAECRLILACLKFILNKYDSLAIAEIMLLAGGSAIEEIIKDRLEFLGKEQEGNRWEQWGGQDKFIAHLNVLKQEVEELSGAEILDLLLEELQLRRLILSWGNVEQRMANVDRLAHLASQYESNCNRLHLAASLGGFLLWLNELENKELDLQGAGENEHAVNVLTYHRSKGLEFPAVICHNLEAALRADVWGLSIVSETGEVDLQNILGNRWLRYWVNPYADQYRNTLLEERINESEAKAVKQREALAEETRLLYTGMTRARDYMILPTRKNTPVWLNRVCGEGEESRRALDENSPECSWEWEGQLLSKRTEVLYFPNDFPRVPMPGHSPLRLEDRSGKQGHKAARLNPAADDFRHQIRVKIVAEETCAGAMPLSGIPEVNSLGSAILAFFNGCHADYTPAGQLEIAASVLARHEIDEMVNGESLVSQFSAFCGWLESRYPGGQALHCYPLHMEWNGQLFEKEISLLLQTPERLCLVEHVPFAGDEKERRKRTKETAASLHFCKLAARQVFNKNPVEMWIHFPLSGALIKVETELL